MIGLQIHKQVFVPSTSTESSCGNLQCLLTNSPPLEEMEVKVSPKLRIPGPSPPPGEMELLREPVRDCFGSWSFKLCLFLMMHVIIECKMVKLVFKTNLGCFFSHSKNVWKLHLRFLACCQLRFSMSKRLHKESLLLHISPLSSVMSGGILVLPLFPLLLYLTSGSSCTCSDLLGAAGNANKKPKGRFHPTAPIFQV